MTDIPEELQGLAKVDGIDISDGLKYCGGAKAFIKFLSSFYSFIDSKSDEIEKAHDKGDISFYTTKVHSLKSTSRIIGAGMLSAMAESLERAGSTGDRTYVDENTPQLLELYRSYKEKLAPFMEGRQTDTEDESNEHQNTFDARRNPMNSNRVMVIGEKETFLVKVLEQKIKEARIECVYKNFNINEISADWEGTDVVALFMADGDRPDDEVMRFLIDKLTDEGKLMIPMGEKNDLTFIQNRVPGDLIYKTFQRPVDNAEVVGCLSELFSKVKSGEFKKTILVVDDDASYLGLVREWLKDKYRVNMVNSGLQAIKWLGKNKADLILLDHEMPVTSGPQVLEMLRSDDETKKIPVMFLTGKSDKESVMSVVALKPEGYFLKTIEKQELLEKLDEFFILHKS